MQAGVIRSMMDWSVWVDISAQVIIERVRVHWSVICLQQMCLSVKLCEKLGHAMLITIERGSDQICFERPSKGWITVPRRGELTGNLKCGLPRTLGPPCHISAT